MLKRLMRRIKKNSLESRWLRSAFGIIGGTLIVLCAAIAGVTRLYYYEGVRNQITSLHSDTVDRYFSAYSENETTFQNGARLFLDSYTHSDKMEVWVMTASGKPILSSSKLDVSTQNAVPDFDEAMGAENGRAIWRGKDAQGNKVYAVTNILKNADGEVIGAVRYITSVELVDRQVWLIIASIVLLCLSVAAVIISFNKSFITSIVKPIGKLNTAANSIAKGDFNVNTEYPSEDEIGELFQSVATMAQELERSDRVKNDFISTISHELRTPLTAIKGWGETLLSIGESDPILTQKGMQVIVNESGRLASFVEDLLDFSRMQNDNFSMRIQKIDLLAELDATVFVFKERATREGIELNYNVPDFPAPAQGDANRIQQVFVNILDNAIKYTPEGGNVEVSAEIAGKQIVIYVRDTGCGIPEKDLPRIKEKFYKANTTVRGSGIGLAVADEIVHLHHGMLDIDSIEGRGTTVKITLPVEPVPELEERSPENEQQERSEA